MTPSPDVPAQLVHTSVIAWSEFLCGPVTAAEEIAARKLIDRIEIFDEGDAARAADLFNATGRRLRSLRDCMIAALAIHRGAILATKNVVDFKRFEEFGLILL